MNVNLQLSPTENGNSGTLDDWVENVIMGQKVRRTRTEKFDASEFE